MHTYSLRADNLKKKYGEILVFRDISLTHTQGILGIAGANGSGKSTLLQCLAGLSRPTAGTIQWQQAGQTISKEHLKSKLGYAAPYISLYPELSCAENLQFLGQLHDNQPEEDNITETLQLVEMTPQASQPFKSLSTGQKQRMRIAAALFHQPGILFLDEPGSNLDADGRQMIHTVVDDARMKEKLVIVASNNGEELNLCDRVYSVEKEQFI